MTLHQRILDAARRTKATLYVITAVYVGIGFFLAIPAAMSGDRLTAFLGFLIISGALGAAAVVGAVVRLTTRITAAGKHIEEIRDRLELIERAMGSRDDTPSGGEQGYMIDLAAFGKGDPDILVAASLDRDAFPRLVATMEEQPPAASADPEPDAVRTGASNGSPAQPDHVQQSDSGDETTRLTTKNLLREWRLGLRNGDLIACRAVYATLVDVVDPADLAPVKTQLNQLANRKEKSLREAFAKCAHMRDYAGMLAVGAEISTLLPDRPVAADFARIKPLLLRQLEQERESATPPTLRVVR